MIQPPSHMTEFVIGIFNFEPVIEISSSDLLCCGCHLSQRHKRTLCNRVAGETCQQQRYGKCDKKNAEELKHPITKRYQAIAQAYKHRSTLHRMKMTYNEGVRAIGQLYDSLVEVLVSLIGERWASETHSIQRLTSIEHYA